MIQNYTFWLLFIALISGNTVFSQTTDITEHETDITDLTYQYPYSEKRSKVMKDGKWGFLNVGEKVAIPLKYDDASSFLYGLARVQRGTKFSVIDFRGKQIMPWFDYVYPFYNGLARIKNRNKTAFVNQKGEIASDWFDAAYVYYYGLMRVKKGHKWAYMDKNGKVVTNWYYLPEELHKSIKIELQTGRYNRKTVVVFNEKGEQITDRFPGNFYEKSFNNTTIFDSLKFDRYIATSQHTLYTENISLIKNEKGLYAYQNDGGMQITDWLMEAENYYEGVARMVSIEGKMAYLGANGKKITPWYDKVFPFFNRLAIVQHNDKYAFIDKTGKLKTDWYDYASQFSDGLAKVGLEKKWGYIDSRGQQVIPLVYDDAMSFSYGFARVEVDGRQLVINKRNKVMHEAFEHIYRFTDSIAPIELGGYYAYIDRTGTRITPWLDGASDFSYGVARVCLDGKIALINNRGKVITPWYEKAYYAPPNLVLGDTLPNGKVGRYILFDMFKYDNNFRKYTNANEHDNFYNMAWNYTDREPPMSWNDGFFKEGVHVVYRQKGKELAASKYSGAALADYNDKTLTPWFDEVYKSDDGLIIGRKDEKYTLLNIYGEILSRQYDGIYYYKPEEIMVQLNEKFAFIDRKDTVISEWFDDIGEFNEGFSVVMRENKFALMTDKFDVISEWYDYMDDEFTYGMRRIKLGALWGAIRKEGFRVVEPEYENADFINGLLRVKKEKVYYLYDINGNLIKKE